MYQFIIWQWYECITSSIKISCLDKIRQRNEPFSSAEENTGWQLICHYKSSDLVNISTNCYSIAKQEKVLSDRKYCYYLDCCLLVFITANQISVFLSCVKAFFAYFNQSKISISWQMLFSMPITLVPPLHSFQPIRFQESVGAFTSGNSAWVSRCETACSIKTQETTEGRKGIFHAFQ